MIEQKVIFGCDHIISAVRTELQIHSIVRGFAGTAANRDRIAAGVHISQVLYVYQEIDGAIVTYRNGTDYTVDGNEIVWSGASFPADGSTYSCEAVTNYRAVENYAANPALCSRCCGQGWYVDAIGATQRSMEKATGVNKLVQDYIKILYTEQQEDGYGTNLLGLAGNEVISESVYLSEISSELYSASAQLKEIQAELSSDDEDALTPEELLSGIEINEISYDKESCTAYVNMDLISEAGLSAATLSFQF